MPSDEMMRAMVLERLGELPRMRKLPIPMPRPDHALIKVHACGVCRTDLHVVDGEPAHSKLHLIPGHEIIGTVVEKGELAEGFGIGQRIGVPWLGYSDGQCRYCIRAKENLCDNAQFICYTSDGGYAKYAVANQTGCPVSLQALRLIRGEGLIGTLLQTNQAGLS